MESGSLRCQGYKRTAEAPAPDSSEREWKKKKIYLKVSNIFQATLKDQQNEKEKISICLSKAQWEKFLSKILKVNILKYL